MGRKKYTQRNVFEIPSYRNVIHLISIAENSDNKEILRSHLRVALCEKHDLDISKKQEEKIKDFFSISEELLSELYSRKIQKHKDFKFFTKNELKKMEQIGWLNDKTKFKNANVLNDVLYRLKKDLKLIDTRESKKGYDYYILTEKGNVEYARYRLKQDIDRLPDDETLFFALQDLFYSVIREYKK